MFFRVLTWHLLSFGGLGVLGFMGPANSGNVPEPTVDQRFNVQDSHRPTFALQRTLPPRGEMGSRDEWIGFLFQEAVKKMEQKHPGCFENTNNKNRGSGIFVFVVFFWGGMVREKKGGRMTIETSKLKLGFFRRVLWKNISKLDHIHRPGWKIFKILETTT